MSGELADFGDRKARESPGVTGRVFKSQWEGFPLTDKLRDMLELPPLARVLVIPHFLGACLPLPDLFCR